MLLTPFKKVLIIFFVTAIAVHISLPKELPLKFSVGDFKIDTTVYRNDINFSVGSKHYHKSLDLALGLDLAGGSHLVFEADTSELSDEQKETALAGVSEVISRRVNLYGVSEPNIQLSSFEGKDRIIVELPGVENTKEAIDLIGETASLTFVELTEEPVEEEVDEEIIIEEDSLYPPGTKPTELTGKNLESAQVTFDQTSGSPVVSLQFDEEGATLFEEITGRNVGKPVIIFLDGIVVSSPIVNSKISGGLAQITGDFELDDAKNLAIQLNAGALPVSVELVQENSIGATLGAESVQRSIIAGLVGLAMVMLFMILMYGKFGLIADIGLVIFGVLTLSLYKLIPVVLTLPGIAGFLLSVGMAVDSNILIFERFKEEKGHHRFANALEISFGRAWDSIRDANIATLVTAFILANPFDWSFLHTSGPVRGFAITLSLGIVVSLFTGVVVTRNLLRVFVKTKIRKKRK